MQVTTKGRRELRRIREERNAWLAERLTRLDDDESRPARGRAALVLEHLIGTVPGPGADTSGAADDTDTSGTADETPGTADEPSAAP